jgi:hypothetical protein
MADLDPDAQEQAAYQDNPAYKRTLQDDWFMATYPKNQFVMRNVNVRLDDATGQYVLIDDAPQVVVIFHDGTISLNGDKRHGNWRAKNRGDLIVMEIATNKDDLTKKTRYTFCHVKNTHAWLSNRNDWTQSVLVYA